jgi:hypothetical protein
VIEPTDEMVQAYVDAWQERLFKEPQDQDRPAVRAGLAAVLALVERDYRALLEDLADPDPCQYDHHGYCQAHGWLQTDPRCPHLRAKELL